MREEHKEPSAGKLNDQPHQEVSMLDNALQSEVESLRSALEEERKKTEEQGKLAEEYLDHLKRLKAEFDNFRKREMLYRQNFVKTANRDLILKILPVLDDMEKALSEGEKGGFGTDPFYQGVELIYRKFLTLLEKEGVRQLLALGQKFDPKYHEAVSTVSLPEREDYEIVEELRKGYLLHDEVMRPAQVVVNRHSEEKMA
ncbi:MAG: nucleotide exchange factor GrpE [Atribacterota bacterium]